MTSGITAAQARALSQLSSHGADEVVNEISSSIDANSRTGATSVTHIFSKEAVTESALQGATATLESRGFTVDRIETTAANFTIKVSW